MSSAKLSHITTHALNPNEPFYASLSAAEQPYLANPLGTLSLHIIHTKSLDAPTIHRLFPASSTLHYYVRVDFLDKSFFTKLMLDVPADSARIVVDHLITFQIEDIAAHDGAENQIVTFHLIAVDDADPQRHIVIGSVEKELLAFIRGMIESEMVLLTRPARMDPVKGGYEGQRTMGILLIKSAFSYGRFGYGFSNQIADERMAPSDAVKHCMFPRFAPPSDRKQECGNVLRFAALPPPADLATVTDCVEVGHPALRAFSSSSDHNEEESAIREAVPWLNPSLERTIAVSKDFLADKIKKLGSMKSATRQMMFLREMCAPSPTV
ncbi:uncharacterized protein LOC129600848 [Paramacrobiotus metropolitanus]|uniref:uncharacterized protein LOC129600848 n=1 Tax=Paramacrobiotus metropolitanus TaxID=2943436 RepID=UPI0024462C1F|nr:uncharacterized protein LOC129600848 [Paramacrobiotus metropolitanus]